MYRYFYKATLIICRKMTYGSFIRGCFIVTRRHKAVAKVGVCAGVAAFTVSRSLPRQGYVSQAFRSRVLTGHSRVTGAPLAGSCVARSATNPPLPPPAVGTAESTTAVTRNLWNLTAGFLAGSSLTRPDLLITKGLLQEN